ncbi:unnamed protein product [Durusdinium trenchii]|uniref:Uncharacterized protein n=1 Tax=Durusdinium trenchii TaxID=1381693 RepID=A0ABP0I7F2_9DINO
MDAAQAPAAATSIPSSAGWAESITAGGGATAKEQEMHRRLLSMETKLKDVDLHLKERLPQPKIPIQQWTQELEEMQKSREALQAKAEGLEQILLKERQQQEASLEAHSSNMERSLEAIASSIDQSITESTNLMKARMIEAESLVKKLVSQLNSTFAKPLKEDAQVTTGPGDSEQLVSSMTNLLEEHQQLVQRQQHLLARRGPVSGNVKFTTFQAYSASPPYPRQTLDGSPRSPSHPVLGLSPQSSTKALKSSASASPLSSPHARGATSPGLAGSRSPKSPRSPHRWPPRSPRGSPKVLPPEGEATQESMAQRYSAVQALSKAIYET